MALDEVRHFVHDDVLQAFCGLLRQIGVERVAKAIGGEIERRFGWLMLPGVRETMAIESQEKRKEAKAVGIAEAARLLRVSPYTVRLYIQGKIHAVHFGRRVLVPMESIQNVLKEGVARGRTK